MRVESERQGAWFFADMVSEEVYFCMGAYSLILDTVLCNLVLVIKWKKAKFSYLFLIKLWTVLIKKE